ncbi:MAG: ABC transporter permease subunit, partial [Vicinamibacterales bacterium]
MNRSRIAVLIGKELREFRANPSAVVPVVLVILVCLALPFVVMVVVPRVTGESLAADPALRRAVTMASRHVPGLAELPPGSAAEAFLFQQFLLLFLVAPVVGAVSLAAYSVVGEKQGRTLEPLLTTPLTTAEMLLSKVIAA